MGAFGASHVLWLGLLHVKQVRMLLLTSKTYLRGALVDMLGHIFKGKDNYSGQSSVPVSPSFDISCWTPSEKVVYSVGSEVLFVTFEGFYRCQVLIS